MRPSSMHFFPLSSPFMYFLSFLFIAVIVLIELYLFRRAYAKIGIHHRYVSLMLLCTILGSYVNIPVAELPPEEVVSDQLVTAHGVSYVVPKVEHWPRTVIAVNVGGALIPTVLSIWLLVRYRLYVRGLIGVALVAFAVHHFARPERGIGVSTPGWVPPLAALVTALVLSWRDAAPLAYIVGSLGTLIGADLLNLDKVQGQGAPVMSIGGAGTFDSVFLAGMLAVLLAPASSLREPDLPVTKVIASEG